MRYLLLALFTFIALRADAAQPYTQADVGRVTDYIAQRYGDGTPVAKAAGVYIRSAVSLWVQTAQTQQYDREATVQAAIREVCFRTQLTLAGASNPQADVDELERTAAQNSVLYAGYVYATALAQQHPLEGVRVTPRQACEAAGIALPVGGQ